MESVSTIVTPPKAGKVAFQRGLICGLAQAVVASSILLINTFGGVSIGIGLLLSTLSFFAGLAAYLIAGMLGSKETGRVSTGVFTGMWTGGIYGIIDFVVSIVIFFQITYPKILDAASTSGAYSNNMEAFKTGAMIGGVGGPIFGVLFAVGLGAGLGALGGLIGRNRSIFKPVVVMPVYAAYPGQPVPYAPYAAPMQPGAYAAPVQPALYAPQAPMQPGAYAVPEQPAPYAPQASAEQIYIEQSVANPNVEQ